MATYPNTYVQFHASDITLMLDADAAYLEIPKPRSRIAGYYYLGNKPNAKHYPDLNDAIQIECKTLKHVVSSVSES